MKTFTFILLITFLNINAQVSDFKDVNFTRADNLAKLYEGESLKNVALLTHNLTKPLKTDVEKFRAIYKWVCSNIHGDYSLSNRIIAKNKKYKNSPEISRQWQLSILPKVLKKLTKQKKTMCTGYAYLLKHMSKLAGIECQLIHGYSRGSELNLHSFDLINHSWNTVKLNDKWYLCDPTWSSGYINESYEFIEDYNDGYFLTEPELFAKNHYPMDEKWLLSNQHSSDLFLKFPIVYNESFKHLVYPVSPSKLKIKTSNKQETTLTLTCSKEQKESFDLVIEKGSFINRITPKTRYNREKNEISLSHRIRTKGNFKLHVLVDDDIVATYFVAND